MGFWDKRGYLGQRYGDWLGTRIIYLLLRTRRVEYRNSLNMERINNELERTLRSYLIAADRLLLLNNEPVDKNNIQEIKSQLVRLIPSYNDLGEQLG